MKEKESFAMRQTKKTELYQKLDSLREQLLGERTKENNYNEKIFKTNILYKSTLEAIKWAREDKGKVWRNNACGYYVSFHDNNEAIKLLNEDRAKFKADIEGTLKTQQVMAQEKQIEILGRMADLILEMKKADCFKPDV